ncbi:MAG: efflux RND transporter permease subunit, partial [Acidobacteriota bacterium]
MHTPHDHSNPETAVTERNDTPRGLLAWFATNHVAANLLMAFFLIGGGVMMFQLQVEIFPSIDPKTITVAVPYPGATPTEVEEGGTRRVEEAVTGIDGVKRIRAVSLEGGGTVTIELEDHADDREVLDDVKSAIDQIADFPPPDAEDPEVSDTRFSNDVLSIALYGDAPERSLRELAFLIRDELIAGGEVSDINIRGVRDYEIAIEIRERDLRARDLSFEEVAAAVNGFSVNLPAGSIRSEDGDILLRTNTQAYRQQDFESLVLRTSPDGTVVRLRDVATVVDGFEDVDRLTLFNNQPAVFLDIARVGDQRALDVEHAIRQYLTRVSLPDGISLVIWDNAT